MKKSQHYCAADPDWATHFEWVVNEPKRRTTEHFEFGVETDNPVLFVLAVVSTPQDGVPQSLDTKIEFGELGTGVPLLAKGKQAVFPGKPAILQIVERPEFGAWRITATHGSRPFAISTMAFHPASPSVAVTTATTKCRICRHTSKALALAIVAATGAAATPALIAAVGTFLAAAGATAAAAAAVGAAGASSGVTATAVAAFIGGMAGDPAAVVASKLCNYVRLCP